MNIVIIKYNAGNIHSVKIALNRLGIEPVVSDDPDVIRTAEKVIFPGVGEASTAMEYLSKNNLTGVIRGLKQPFLGICLGLQLMCAYSEENNTTCLNVFDVQVRKFPPKDKVPHMGWNNITGLSGPLFNKIPDGSFVYFVHSFYAETGPETIATGNYILPFSAGLNKDNFYALQFHPEKSGKTGEQILRNFLAL
ncbi:MAG: imidazole glycerol phosphate synthase subunit HisH [Calditrichaceae bacterium]|nr:imidazole glycerol phosphate synthase subunit HisH [Calditrichaceae bacterium]MBN2708869.1 imidazole glycerol phosphate synthase subunit HisH [Calditrichaceae bacterium]RQV97605.1 MAG: imidazole glycerol phosphate synthase subunit HisH [Calditrichota bacterium]